MFIESKRSTNVSWPSKTISVDPFSPPVGVHPLQSGSLILSSRKPKRWVRQFQRLLDAKEDSHLARLAACFQEPDRQLAVGQNQWYHFGVAAPSIFVDFSGDWDLQEPAGLEVWRQTKSCLSLYW